MFMSAVENKTLKQFVLGLVCQLLRAFRFIIHDFVAPKQGKD